MSDPALAIPDELERTRRLVRCAQLYYGLVPGERGELRQSDVARRLGVPRSQVVLWLKEARERFIEIRLRAPRALALELPLETRLAPFGVREVRAVIDGGLSREGAEEAVGAEAARAVRSRLRAGLRVGFSGGRTVLQAVRELSRGERLPRLDLYPLAAGGSLPVSANALAAMVAGNSAPGTRASGLWVPTLRSEGDAGASSGKEERAFLRSPEVRAVYREAQRVDLALLGIGAVGEAEGRRRAREYLGLSAAAARSLARSGARGFILQQFIDASGRACPRPPGERNLAVPLAAVRGAAAAHPRRTVILAAAGAAKTLAVAAAVRGRLANVLVIDAAIGERLLEEFPL